MTDVLIKRELLEDLRDAANDCLNHEIMRGNDRNVPAYTELVEQADMALAAPRQPDSNPFFDNRIARELLEDRAKQWPMSAPRQPEGEGLEVVGYATKSELEPLLDETMPEGKYIRIGLDHPGCWKDDTPYPHLEAICRLSDAQRAIAELREECNTLRQQLAEMTKDRDDCLSARKHYVEKVGDALAQNYTLAELLRHARLKMAYMLKHGEWHSPEELIERIDAALAEVKP